MQFDEDILLFKPSKGYSKSNSDKRLKNSIICRYKANINALSMMTKFHQVIILKVLELRI